MVYDMEKKCDTVWLENVENNRFPSNRFPEIDILEVVLFALFSARNCVRLKPPGHLVSTELNLSPTRELVSLFLKSMVIMVITWNLFTWKRLTYQTPKRWETGGIFTIFRRKQCQSICTIGRHTRIRYMGNNATMLTPCLSSIPSLQSVIILECELRYLMEFQFPIALYTVNCFYCRSCFTIKLKILNSSRWKKYNCR